MRVLSLPLLRRNEAILGEGMILVVVSGRFECCVRDCWNVWAWNEDVGGKLSRKESRDLPFKYENSGKFFSIAL